MTQQSSWWVERLARFGYAAKGLVYIIVGLLAAQLAVGLGGKTTDTRGALQTIVIQPFGKFLLSLVAVGLMGYVLWRFFQAIKDTERHGNSAKGIVQRLSYGMSGLIYAGLALSAVRIVLGTGGGRGNSTQAGTAHLLAQPFGQWLVGIVGAIVIGMGCQQFYKAYSGKFRRQLKLGQMSNQQATWVVRLGRFGISARGVVFIVIGGFLVQAARKSDPKEAKSLGGVLQALLEQPHGPWLLGVVALGLVAYGIYMGVQARYRQIATS
jgi:hypothetical protein